MFKTPASAWHTIRELRRRSRSRWELRMPSELERRDLAYGYGRRALQVVLAGRDPVPGSGASASSMRAASFGTLARS
jgi:hypothetical protein